MVRAEVSSIRGDAGAVEVLYRQQAERLGRLAYLLTGGSGEAEELVQEAFARLFARWRLIRDPAALESYLRRTIVNLAQKTWRKRTTERSYLESSPLREADLSATQPDLETGDQLRQLLRTLPFRQHAAIVLRYYEDLPEREIAALLGCPIGSVKSSLARGLHAMKIQMEEDADE